MHSDEYSTYVSGKCPRCSHDDHCATPCPHCKCGPGIVTPFALDKALRAVVGDPVVDNVNIGKALDMAIIELWLCQTPYSNHNADVIRRAYRRMTAHGTLYHVR